MKSFAFIVCPKTMEQLKKFWPRIRFVPEFILKFFLKNSPSFKLSHIQSIRSTQGKEAEGYIIACPILNTANPDRGSALDKIISAGHLAERLDVDILGLGGCAPIERGNLYPILKSLTIPVTSGNILTAWTIFEAVHRTARIKSIDLKRTAVFINDANDPVGELCAYKFSEQARKITVSTIDRGGLEQFKERLLYINPVIEIIVEDDAGKAVKDTDIVVVVNQAAEISKMTQGLKSGAILCYLPAAKNLVKKECQRKDITLVEAGLIKLPAPSSFAINADLPKGIIYAPMAEAILLTFEGRFVSHSLNEETNPDNLEEIADIAVQHGFEVWVPEAPVL